MTLSTRVRYRCHPEREQLRQAAYRAAAKAGIRIHVLTDGGGYGWLRAFPIIAGRCIERRQAERFEPLSYDPNFDEAADLRAVAEMVKTIRTICGSATSRSTSER